MTGRSKHQRGARCIYRDMTARELDRVIDTQAELLAALEMAAVRLESGNEVDRACASHCRAAIAKACKARILCGTAGYCRGGNHETPHL